MSDDRQVYGDDSERRNAETYSRIHQWLVLAGLAWGLATNAAVLITGLSSRLRDIARAYTPQQLSPVGLYVLASSLISFVAGLPLSYFAGVVVERRFNLSNQSRAEWFAEQLKGLGVGVVLGVPLAQGLFWIVRRYPRRWWAVVSVLTIPVTVIFANLAPILILPLFNRFEPLRDQALARRIRELAASQGVAVSDVQQMDMSKQTKKANAFFAGIGRTRRIVLGDTLVDALSPDEIEVVLAHELGHQVHRDLWKLVGLGAAVTALTSYAVNALAPWLIDRFGDRWGLQSDEGIADVAALPVLALVTTGTSLLLTPVQNAITRNLIEHPADEYALNLTGNRQAFIGAMQKLGRMNLSNPRPSPLIKWLLHDHPPLGERIDYARSVWRSGEDVTGT